ncbi:MAG: nicotinamide riboside transporter PnuC [Bacteroidales bacterium]|nr:nicotinamide riboside transporter PnuC [Bacteroidales bacterium]
MIEYLTANWLEILGTLTGILYLYWEYQADVKVWIAGIIMPAISIVVYFEAGLYADFGINIYYLLAAIYGWCVWKFARGRKTQAELPITHTPRQLYLWLAVVFAISFVVIGEVLVRFTNSDVPWWDSFTTALSIVGMWMLARKFVEQWIAWIAVDAVCTGLYIYKEIYFYAALYALYTFIAVLGYRKWQHLMHASKQ